MTRRNHHPLAGGRAPCGIYKALAMASIALVAARAGQAHAQNVSPAVPGGPTSVNVGPGGRITVGIAPADGRGVSHNQYNSFSVPRAGVDLDNARVGAGMILNEVTSSRRSFLNGPLSVLGPRAHVVIVNPNGISVDGAHFNNAGAVVLSSGKLLDGPGASGPVVTSGSGDILVSGAGLSGAVSSLQLLAARMKIDGPIVNEHVSPDASLELTAGNAELLLDPSAPAASARRSVVREKRLRGGTVQEAVIDVTPRGLLSASRVTLAASGDGAGVRFAGAGKAPVGAFTIDATGKVAIRGATITGERAVNVRAASIEVLNAPDARAALFSNRGAVTVLATAGDIDLTGQIIGTARTDEPGDWPEARGAVTMSATGDIRLLGKEAERLAVIYGSAGDVALNAGGAVVSHSARIRSDNQVLVRAARVENATDMVGAARSGPEYVLLRGKRSWRTLWMKRSKRLFIRQQFPALRLPDIHGAITAASVAISADEVVNSGLIIAGDGSVIVRAKRLRNVANWTGDIWYAKHCNLTCWGRAEARTILAGGLIDASAGIAIDASESLINEHGQISARGDVDMVSPRVAAVGALQPAANMRPPDLGVLFAGRTPWFSWEPIGGDITAEEGRLSILAPNPVEVDGGKLTGGAGTFIPGGKHENPERASRGAAERKIGLFRKLLP